MTDDSRSYNTRASLAGDFKALAAIAAAAAVLAKMKRH